MGRWIVTLALLVGCFALTEWLPFSPYFRNMDTMIHEFGHAAATLLLSGEVQYIHLYEDHSGVTLSAVESGWRLLPVSLSGYMTASLFAVLLFALHRHGQHRLGLAIVTVVALVCLVLFVRNDFGTQWLLGFIGINVVAFVLPIGFVRVAYYLLLAFLSLVESVVGAITITILAATTPSGAGDAANLANATGIPAIVWGVFFLLFALWCAKRAIGHFLPRPKKPLFSKKRGVSPLS
ncbi:M50 family metallopeptidase [Paenibacillus antri]|uniref:M50 family metallopeptidase n=1 Tax=Paenibacillus antri TaxID=2582848 RepID=A0A5R9G0M8_9BACL|nr:M50 family metallopeptidase [Paenibacillus antri]TLS49331.1 M50 family metallopeptidase [Paenibacillus antri]